MINTSGILMNRLKSLKVLLSIDSPEVRGWSPLVQENAQHVINDAINYIKDTEEYVVRLTQQNTTLSTKLASVIPEKCPICDRTLIDGDWCDNHGRINERLNPNDYR